MTFKTHSARPVSFLSNFLLIKLAFCGASWPSIPVLSMWLNNEYFDFILPAIFSRSLQFSLSLSLSLVGSISMQIS